MATTPMRNPQRSAHFSAERSRILSLPETDRDLVRLAQRDDFSRVVEQLRATGGCEHPIYLAGGSLTRDSATGVVLRSYSTHGEPGGVLAVRCRNRRRTRCEPCSRLHQGDTYQLVRAGLEGGKETPETVAGHPRLFVTLTAPSFGAVHRAADGERCRPHRDGNCPHGYPRRCGMRHTDTDSMNGTPLCRYCYDYTAHALWHAHAGILWDRTTRNIRRAIATELGITQTEFRRHLKLSFSKVAEYQGRGAIHFHAVFRLDGPDGAHSSPHSAANSGVLENAIRKAVESASTVTPYSPAGEHEIYWGTQLDIRTVRESEGKESLTAGTISGYISKYISKGVTDSTTDYPIKSPDQIERRRVSPHIRTLMRTCWRLGGLPELAHLRLRAWAHTLGFRGHCLSKSRAYSTTYKALRTARAAHRGALTAPQDGTTEERAWRYVHAGHTPGTALLATGIADQTRAHIELRREGLGDD